MELINKQPGLYFNLFGTTIGFILTCLVIPFIEEITFRLWLNFKPISLAVTGSLIFYKTIKWKIFEFNFYSIKDYILIFSTFIIGYLIFKTLKNPNILAKLNFLRDNYFKYFFYGNIVLFGLLHISNFKPLDFSIIYIYPFYVLPQLISAIFLGVIRIKYGFGWGVLLHVILNLFPALFFILQQK